MEKILVFLEYCLLRKTSKHHLFELVYSPPYGQDLMTSTYKKLWKLTSCPKIFKNYRASRFKSFLNTFRGVERIEFLIICSPGTTAEGQPVTWWWGFFLSLRCLRQLLVYQFLILQGLLILDRNFQNLFLDFLIIEAYTATYYSYQVWL